MRRRARRVRHLDAARIGTAAKGEEGAVRLALAALRHLNDPACGCPTCRASLAPYPIGRFADRAGEPYRQAIDRAVSDVRRFDDEIEEGEKLLAELREISDIGLAEAQLLSNPRFATLGVALLLLGHAGDALDGKPLEALGLSEVAVCIAEGLDPNRSGGPRFVEDFRALARSRLAAALRSLGLLAQANDELSRAEAHLHQGTGDRSAAGKVALERCRWLLTKQQPAGARELARQVERSSERLRDEELQRDAMLVAARAKRLGGSILDAITELQVLVAVAREGDAPADREARFRLELVATLFEAGEIEAARRQLARLRLLDTLMAAPYVAVRAAAWSGLVEADAGRLPQAADELETAWRGLAAAGLGLEATGAGLALARVYFQADHHEDLATLGAALPELITSDGMPDWAVGTLLAALGGIWQNDPAGLEQAVELIRHAVWYGWSSDNEPTRH